jgi:hypothetical protein
MHEPLDAPTAAQADLAMLREQFGPENVALGWDAVVAFEAEHGVTLPEPYRSFVATISDGSFTGPPEYGLLELGVLPPDWGDERPERHLDKPFSLSAQWIWEDGELPEPEEEQLAPVYTAHSCSAPTAAACTGT